MANAFYAHGRQHFALGEVDWVDDTIKVTLVDTNDYTVDLDNDEFFSDVASGARIATATLSGKTADLGVLDAADVTFPSVSGDQAEALVIWKDTGAEGTSPLLMWIDDVVSGLPVTPNGGDIDVTWHEDGIGIL